VSRDKITLSFKVDPSTIYCHAPTAHSIYPSRDLAALRWRSNLPLLFRQKEDQCLLGSFLQFTATVPQPVEALSSSFALPPMQPPPLVVHGKLVRFFKPETAVLHTLVLLACKYGCDATQHDYASTLRLTPAVHTRSLGSRTHYSLPLSPCAFISPLCPPT
jgi:hypothetical protein